MSLPKERVVGALDGTGHGCVITQPVPELGPGIVLVKVHVSLISPGTELSGAKKARAAGKTDPGKPRPFGYQNAGEVIAVHGDVTDVSVGDRVACMGAGYAQHANYAVVPQRLCARLPEGVSFEQAAYTHLSATALQAIRRGKPELGENVLIVGMGIVGQLAAQHARLSGAFVMGWDMVPFRCETARKCGIHGTTVVGADDAKSVAEAFTRGDGFDMAVMAFGGDGTEALKAVADVMKRTPDTHQMGRIVLVGGLTTSCGWGAALGNLNLLCSSRTGPGYHDDNWERGQIDYPPVFVRWTTQNSMQLVLRLVSEGRLDVDSLTTHIVPLDQIDDVVTAHIERPDAALGTLLRMPHEEPTP